MAIDKPKEMDADLSCISDPDADSVCISCKMIKGEGTHKWHEPVWCIFITSLLNTEL